ncbi:MAG: RES family NAD+ phosphorylase [Proteobacteria bacterium]|nr:RES family NAD+ phosphorylase [Pseudomonadota bacterium]MDA1024038.1 RES family NAD+ phosphorylase [Pseudomonadota bacterium]
MNRPDRVHDSAVLDQLDAIGPVLFEGNVWRVTRRGRDAVKGSSANGRWSPRDEYGAGEFEVLYASLESEGAYAEIGYRLSLEPVWPSRIDHEIHLIDLQLDRALRLADLSVLSGLGVNIAKYESFDYAATQAIASAAHFLEFDGLVVPSARYDCSNLAVFMDRLGEGHRCEVRETKPVDWTNWHKNRVRE